MSVNSVEYTNYSKTYDATQVSTVKTKEAVTDKVEKNADSYEKGQSTTFDRTGAENAVKAAEAAKAECMQTLFTSMLKTQYSKYVQAMPNSNLGQYFSNLQVDEATRLQAQKDIADDGYWGVEQTAGRILDFAKALAGDDLDKLNEMKEAVEKGFKIAEDLWGGKLPDISGRTYDRVMQGFDEWEKSLNKTVASEQI